MQSQFISVPTLDHPACGLVELVNELRRHRLAHSECIARIKQYKAMQRTKGGAWSYNANSERIKARWHISDARSTIRTLRKRWRKVA